MHYFGLTGIFGSGKSTIRAMFEAIGAYAIDADILVRQLTDSDPALRREIAARIGSESLNPDGTLNRQRIATIVFGDSLKRANLETLLHPYVFSESERLRDEAMRAEPGRPVILEAPLLFESGYERFMDGVIVVTCPLDTVILRLKSRGFSPEDITARLRAQMTQQEKAARATWCIDNGGSLAETRSQVRQVFQKMREGRS